MYIFVTLGFDGVESEIFLKLVQGGTVGYTATRPRSTTKRVFRTGWVNRMNSFSLPPCYCSMIFIYSTIYTIIIYSKKHKFTPILSNNLQFHSTLSKIMNPFIKKYVTKENPYYASSSDDYETTNFLIFYALSKITQRSWRDNKKNCWCNINLQIMQPLVTKNSIEGFKWEKIGLCVLLVIWVLFSLFFRFAV